MAGTVDISGLWNDKTYSDLVIKCASSVWYCHKNIVFSRSDWLHYQALRHERTDSAGRTVKVLSDMWHIGLCCMLHSLYHGAGPNSFRGCDAEDIALASLIARHDGLLEFQAAARAAMLRFSKQSTSEEDALHTVAMMRGTRDSQLTIIADELELKWMPKAILNPETRSELSQGALQRFLDSVEPRNKDKHFEYDTIEHHIRDMPSAAVDGRKRKRRKI
jgi:hypothetical protein